MRDDEIPEPWETTILATNPNYVVQVKCQVPCAHTDGTIKLRSMKLKICAECGAEIPWPLDEGQEPLINNNRATRRTKE